MGIASGSHIGNFCGGRVICIAIHFVASGDATGACIPGEEGSHGNHGGAAYRREQQWS